LEGLITINQYGFLGTGLFEYQQSTKNVTGLDWFIGGGAHAGFVSDHYGYWNDNDVYNNRNWDSALGMDFIAGFEYTFETVPFTIGLDVKPAVNIYGHSPFFFDVGLTCRYNFK
jgi:hypothetical protein